MMYHVDETLPFIGVVHEEALTGPVLDLLVKHGLLGYHGPRVPLPGCPPQDTPAEFIEEWSQVFSHFRNRLLRPLTTCASDDHGPKVRQRLRVAVAMANRELARRYGRTA